MSDARFEDGGEAPLRLLARDADSLEVLSVLTQDAVFAATEMTYAKTRRRFALLLNRFRWEDLPAAMKAGRKPERVQSLLVFEDVMAVQSSGLDRRDKDTVMSLLTISFVPGADGTGRVVLVLAGDAEIALSVESLEASLRDVTRPYLAPSGKTPNHPAE